MRSQYKKLYSIYIDGPAGMETHRHVEAWYIDDATNRLEFTEPVGKKQYVTTQRYSVEEE